MRGALRELARAGAGFADRAIAGSLPDDDAEAGDDGDGAADVARLVELADEYAAEHRPPTPTASWPGSLPRRPTTGAGGDGVELRTFHAAKGLEWPVVHLFGVEEGYVPIATRPHAEAAAEERRLFYVACTRAERRLRITWAATRRFGDDAAARRPSPYLAELRPTLDALRAGTHRPTGGPISRRPPPPTPLTPDPADPDRRPPAWR